jgi:ATP-dependent Clp protease ATP-binding subunit ClpX
MINNLYNIRDLDPDVKVYLEPQFKRTRKPSDLVAELDKFVIGQDAAKKALAIAMVNHEVITEHNRRIKKSETRLKKTNLMLVGPSGTGKTYLLEVIGRTLGKDVMAVDISSYTQAGYVGRDLDSIITEACARCDDNPERVENMIIFLDEVDKLSDQEGVGKVGTLAVQQQLLTLIEGQEEYNVTNDKGRNTGFQVDTRNILWVLGGAFTAYRESAIKKLKNPTTIGFATETKEPEEFVFDQQQAIKAGLLRELVGRIGQVIELHDLSREECYRIMVEPVDSIVNQYKILGELRGLNLTLTEKEIWDIVDEAIRLKLGARGLRTLADKLMKDRMYI